MTAWRLTQRLTAQNGTSLSSALRAIGARHRRWAVWLVPAIYAGCIAAFVTDLRSSNTLAFGVFYAPLIVTAVFHRDRRAVWVLTAIACAMNVIGAFFPDVAKDVSGTGWKPGAVDFGIARDSGIHVACALDPGTTRASRPNERKRPNASRLRCWTTSARKFGRHCMR